jgi:hypothetical protein
MEKRGGKGKGKKYTLKFGEGARKKQKKNEEGESVSEGGLHKIISRTVPSPRRRERETT